MDWARDDAVLGERDLKNVFGFEERRTTALRMLAKDEEPFIWSLKSKEEWDDWLHDVVPPLDGSASGLILILAKRTGEQVFPGVKKVRSDDWLETIDAEMAQKKTCKQANQESGFPDCSQITTGGGQRDLKKLPFSRDIFLAITRKLHIHNSIVRAISRSDIPVCSSAEVQMRDQDQTAHTSYVYNCRTTNSWGMDLALTVTYFPHCDLTFAAFFGCPSSVEKSIIERLRVATAEALHPLLLPGIFAELERSRHVRIIESTIDEIEGRILSLDTKPDDMELVPVSQQETKNREKRSQWLDTTYLRNQLISWNTQLAKLVGHTDELKETIFKLPRRQDASAAEGKHEMRNEQMRRVGNKISDRVQEIVDEYDDKIRDCTMRIDGMAMATQWAQGETNVDIALATGRDSRHMRSIALVTMVFLPGTFFASIFSMTFFDWKGSDGGPVVSGFLWVYIVFTVSFTVLTIGSWWYFVVHRQRRRRRLLSEEEAVPLIAS